MSGRRGVRAPVAARGDPGWLGLQRRARIPEVLLIDHANCEKKAASTALALMFAYAEDLELTDKMSRLAREELRHYEQVAKLIRALKIAPQRLAPGRYATQLRRLVASRRATARSGPDDLRRVHRGAVLRAIRRAGRRHRPAVG